MKQNSVDAEFGFSGGGTLNVSMKSGTNKFHGAPSWDSITSRRASLQGQRSYSRRRRRRTLLMRRLTPGWGRLIWAWAKYRKAIPKLEAALQAQPKNVEILFYLARAYAGVSTHKR
ncbi:MAG: hypothetical protein DMG57_30800 [Acidobacteria bacterium]|nr:MAG: hypothetical protein DMG57_30800 [Acidobacteriota bacterium]